MSRTQGEGQSTDPYDFFIRTAVSVETSWQSLVVNAPIISYDKVLKALYGVQINIYIQNFAGL